MTLSGPPDLQPLTRPRLYEQVAEKIMAWVDDNHLRPGDRLLPERELAARLDVSRATVSQALVALEVIGIVAVRHGNGTVLTGTETSAKVIDSLRAHAGRMPDILDARDALETKIAALAARRRTAGDLRQIASALRVMEKDVAQGGRGVEGDELFHAAVTAAAHSELLAKMMDEISPLIVETRLESLSQPGRPGDSLASHTRIADAIKSQESATAAAAMHAHLEMVSDVAILRADAG